MADLFYINQIPFFLTYSCQVCFMHVMHLKDHKAKMIFKAFIKAYNYYKKHGFNITTLHADGEFAPLQELINQHILDGPFVNLASQSEHIPKIKR